MCHIPLGAEDRVCAKAGGGGGGAAAHITASTGRHQRGQWETLRGGGAHDGTNTLAASPGGGGMTGQTPWRHPGGGGDKHPGATSLPHPDEECESCRGKGGEG